MAQHYLLWASGPDRPGIVALVTKALFTLGVNLEDSSMMRLGSEFAIFLIFAADARIPQERLDAALAPLQGRTGLAVGVKAISARQAGFRRSGRATFIVSVHGHDRPGIVYRVTDTLARRKFNVTDLSTHRTTQGHAPGYILFIEGELPSLSALATVKRDLKKLASSLKTHIDIRPVNAEAL